ncbi:hypothetical protein T10_2077 [Trichinella papuae]|uniref:Uncharacterized protein n=1 Tax=Trichinella papuae TaxID=268474 RepID=A0A0V1MWX7_9BILA|nr:hypothetical protein T10_2077 [Trichinella papuae]
MNFTDDDEPVAKIAMKYIDCFESSVCHSFTNFVALALTVINCEVKGSNTATAFNRHISLEIFFITYTNVTHTVITRFENGYENCMLHSPLLSSWPEAWFVTELATFFNTKLYVIFGFLRLQRLCPVLSSESWIAIARILPLAIISFENANAPEFNSSTIAHSFNRRVAAAARCRSTHQI